MGLDYADVQFTNGSIVDCIVGEPIEVRFKNRATFCRAMVLLGDNEPLLGAITQEKMDVFLYPLRQELTVNPDYPYFAQMKMK